MSGSYSMRSPAVKRLMKEAQELREPTEQYHGQPLEDNLFEWHFTIRGPEDSDFEGGIYHGRIVLPPQYPMKPPSIILLTPNGRFEVFKKICLSISGYHPETWQPSWSIRTALLAIIGFLPTHGGGAIGSLEYPSAERKRLARKSRDFRCEECGVVRDQLKEVTSASRAEAEEARRLGAQITMTGEKEKPAGEGDSSPKTTDTPPSPQASTPPSTRSPRPPFTVPPFPPVAAPPPRVQNMPAAGEGLRRREGPWQEPGPAPRHEAYDDDDWEDLEEGRQPVVPSGDWSLYAIYVLVLSIALLVLRRVLSSSTPI